MGIIITQVIIPLLTISAKMMIVLAIWPRVCELLRHFSY